MGDVDAGEVGEVIGLAEAGFDVGVVSASEDDEVVGKLRLVAAGVFGFEAVHEIAAAVVVGLAGLAEELGLGGFRAGPGLLLASGVPVRIS